MCSGTLGSKSGLTYQGAIKLKIQRTGDTQSLADIGEKVSVTIFLTG